MTNACNLSDTTAATTNRALHHHQCYLLTPLTPLRWHPVLPPHTVVSRLRCFWNQLILAARVPLAADKRAWRDRLLMLSSIWLIYSGTDGPSLTFNHIWGSHVTHKAQIFKENVWSVLMSCIYQNCLVWLHMTEIINCGKKSLYLWLVPFVLSFKITKYFKVL